MIFSSHGRLLHITFKVLGIWEKPGVVNSSFDDFLELSASSFVTLLGRI